MANFLLAEFYENKPFQVRQWASSNSYGSRYFLAATVIAVEVVAKIKEVEQKEVP